MDKTKLKMISCIACGEPMPELRLTKFGYKVCVNCSTVGSYKAITTINGSGDHTWNDIQIMTSDEYDNYENIQNNNKKALKDLNNNKE